MSDSIGVSRRHLLSTGSKAAVLVAAVGIAPTFIRPGRAFAADALSPGDDRGTHRFRRLGALSIRARHARGTGRRGRKGHEGGRPGPHRARSVRRIDRPAHQPFPAGAPSIKDLWEKETGITLDIVGVPNGQEFTKTMQDISTKGGAYDIYSVEWNRLGDLAETGGIIKLDDYVAKHRPEWDLPTTGYVDGAKGVSLLNRYRGSTYGVSLDGDFQMWVYRTDLFGDESEKRAFKDKYGYDLLLPKTWKQLDEMSMFFHRPDKNMLGTTDLRNQGWGYTNWYQRYVTMASPNQYLFSDDAVPLINSLQGVAATKEYVDSLAYKSPDAVSWGWPEQYGNFAKSGAAITCAFSNLPKFLDNAGNKDSQVTGKIGSILPPGRDIDGKRISRSVLWLNLSASVSTQAKNPELCYVFLQWLGSARIYAWMSANPSGYLDPFRLSDFSDPLVRQTYHAYHVDVLRETVARTVPTINYPGATAFHNALDENLVAACTKAKTPEQAMADTDAAWKKIVRRTGEEKIVEAIKANNSAWPTVLDAVA